MKHVLTTKLGLLKNKQNKLFGALFDYMTGYYNIPLSGSHTQFVIMEDVNGVEDFLRPAILPSDGRGA